MRYLVTGGAGFIGSHLCHALLARGDAVVCVDDLSTGRAENIARLLDQPEFQFIEADVAAGLDVAGRLDVVAHLASPASPPDYLRHPLETLAVGSRGTENALRLAHREKARFVLASTSEVYGDPAVHPQREEYWGNVNPIGPRSVCYIDDLVRGILAMADSTTAGPLNLGNPAEFAVADFARLVLRITGSDSVIEHRPLPVDDPARRCPVIGRAISVLRWRPEVSTEAGVRKTVEWFRSAEGAVARQKTGTQRRAGI